MLVKSGFVQMTAKFLFIAAVLALLSTSPNSGPYFPALSPAGNAEAESSVCGDGLITRLSLPLVSNSTLGGIKAPPDFALRLADHCIEVETGSPSGAGPAGSMLQRALQVWLVGLNGFSDQTSLSFQATSTGISAEFSPQKAAPGATIFLNLLIPANLPPGAYPLTIEGESSGIVHQASFWLINRLGDEPAVGEEGELRPDELPVLAASALTPSTAFPLLGEEITLKIDVRNMGAAGVRSVAVALYAGSSQIAIRYFSLNPNSAFTFDVPWTPTELGKVTLTAAVDPYEAIIEDERLDNSISSEVVVAGQPPSGSELAAANIDLVTPAARPSVLRATVRNNGSSTLQAPLVFYVNGQVAAMQFTGALAPQQSAIVEVPWPADPPPAQLSVEINPRFKSLEVNSIDNLFVKDLQPEIDLRVENLSVYSLKREAAIPWLVTISFRVRNAGKQDIAQTFRTMVNPGIFIDDIDLPHLDPYYVTTQGLAAGETVYISRSFPNIDSQFDIQVQTDFDGDVSEDIEGNNIINSNYADPRGDVGRWYSIGPRRLTEGIGATGRLHAIAVDPSDPATLYVGAPTGSPGGDPAIQGGGSGIWKTTDGGTTWWPTADSFPMLQINALAIDPSNSARLYAVVNSFGVFGTEDAGTSWKLLAQDSRFDGDVLRVDPSDPNRLYMTTTNGVFRSSDRGANWEPVLTDGNAADLEINSAAPTRLYASMSKRDNIAITGIYISFNGGDDWRKLSGCPGGRLPSLTDNARITLAQSQGVWYAGYLVKSESQSSFTIYRTTSLGCSIGGVLEKSWEARWTVGGPAGSNEAKLAAEFWGQVNADPANPSYVYAGGTGIWISTNGGGVFSESNGPHADHHGFATDPSTSGLIYDVNDGGIYRSSDHGKSGTWQFIGEGLANVEFYDIAQAQTDARYVIGGTQDNGTNLYDGLSTIWNHIRGGDGAMVDFDPGNASIYYSFGQYANSIQRWSPSSNQWQALNQGLPEDSQCFNMYYQVHPKNSALIVASCQGQLWRSPTAPPGDWQVIFTPPVGGGNVNISQIDPSVDLYYAGTTNGSLYAGPSGTNFQSVFQHPNSWKITDIELDPYAQATVFVSFGGSTGIDRIQMLKRTSPAPTTMTNLGIASNLPSGLTVRTLAVDRMNAYTLYAGMVQGGVYQGRSFDGGSTWTWRAFNDGIPSAADIRDLLVNPISGVLRAGTMGRSAFEINTDYPIGSVLSAQGKLTFLRVNEAGDGYGPPNDFINAEVIIKLDTQPNKGFGFQLRPGSEEAAHRGMLDDLRDAFNHDSTVKIDYVRTGIHNGLILRVMSLP